MVTKTPIDTRYGSMITVGKEDDLIHRHLVQFGEWGWNEIDFLNDLIPNKARILDIGAFIGTFSLGLAQKGKVSFVCAVEGNPNSFTALQQNLENNLSIPFAAVQAIVGSENSLVFSKVEDSHNLGGTHFVLKEKKTKGQTASSLKNESQTYNLPFLREKYGPFDLIKLDVEGMEQMIVAGDIPYLSSGACLLWMECNEDPRSLELVNVLLRWKLPIYYAAVPVYNPDNAKQNSAPIFPFAYEGGLLVCPSNQKPVINNALQKQEFMLSRISSVEDLKHALWLTPRWGEQQWLNQNPSTLVAMVGRELVGDHYETFLQEKTKKEKQKKDLIERQKIALEETQELALQRLEIIEEKEKQIILLESQSKTIENSKIEFMTTIAMFEQKLQDINHQYAQTLIEFGANQEQTKIIQQRLRKSEQKIQIYCRCLENIKFNLCQQISFPEFTTDEEQADFLLIYNSINQLHHRLAEAEAWNIAYKHSFIFRLTRPIQIWLEHKPILLKILRKVKHSIGRVIRSLQRS